MIHITKVDRHKIYFKDPFRVLRNYKPALGKQQIYTLPLNYDTCLAFKKYSWNWDKVKNYFKDFNHHYQVAKKYNKRCDDITPAFIKTLNIPSELDWLRDYQKLDAYVCAHRKSFANLNYMRSGKTPTTCASLHLRYLKDPKNNSKHIISILQATVWQWKTELNKACSEFQILDLTNANKKQRAMLWEHFITATDPVILLINREKLPLDVPPDSAVLETLEKVKYGLVVDEAHFLRNRKTKLSATHTWLSRYAMYRLALTGTEIGNHGSDLFGLFRFLYPHIYTSYWAFCDRYLQAQEMVYGLESYTEYTDFDPTTKTELMRLIFMNSIRRTKEEVLSYLPEYQIGEPLMLEMSKQDTENYNYLLKTFEFDKNNQFISMANSVALRTKLLQASTMPNEIFNTSGLGVKEKWLMQWLKDNPTAKPIIFARFTNTTIIPLYSRLSAQGYNCAMIIGKTKNKAQIAQLWQDGKFDILLCNLQSGGTGLTLDYADTEIFLERSDNRIDNFQAEQRFLATNPKDNRIKQIIHIVSMYTTDVVQYGQLHNKLEWVKQITPAKIYNRLLAVEKTAPKETN